MRDSKGRVGGKFDYTSPDAAYSLRVDPVTGKGPMGVDSRLFTRADSYTATGAARNKNQFWKMWSEKYPETMSGDNLQAVKNGLAPVVDSQWIKHFPEHHACLKDLLVHHHIDHGNFVTGLPYTIHSRAPGRSIFHSSLGGKR